MAAVYFKPLIVHKIFYTALFPLCYWYHRVYICVLCEKSFTVFFYAFPVSRPKFENVDLPSFCSHSSVIFCFIFAEVRPEGRIPGRDTSPAMAKGNKESIGHFLKRFILFYLKSRNTERRRAGDRGLPSAGSLPKGHRGWSRTGLKPGARSFSCVSGKGLGTWAILWSFSTPLAGNWNQSGTAGNWTGTQMRCWRCRWRLNVLCVRLSWLPFVIGLVGYGILISKIFFSSFWIYCIAHFCLGKFLLILWTPLYVISCFWW